MIKVNRTCPYCNIDHGILLEQRFYDKDALTNTMTCDLERPYINGGMLNRFLFCGEEECFRKAMLLRKQELESFKNKHEKIHTNTKG